MPLRAVSAHTRWAPVTYIHCPSFARAAQTARRDVATTDPDAQHAMLPTQPLKTYIVEDSPVIRENLIATLEELAPVEVVGTAEDESDARCAGSREPGNQCDLVIVDIFLKAGSGLGVLRAASAQAQHGTSWWC